MIPRPAFVGLTIEELRAAVIVGGNRGVEARAAGRVHRFGMNERERSPWAIDVEGSIAECAVAKFRGVYWSGLGGYNRNVNDVLGAEVRYRSREYYDLLLHDDDHDDAPYVLVTGGTMTGPPERRRFVVTLHGWILGADGKRAEYWNTTIPSAAYLVPKDRLQPIADLNSEIARRARPIADYDDTPRRANEIDF